MSGKKKRDVYVLNKTGSRLRARLALVFYRRDAFPLSFNGLEEKGIHFRSNLSFESHAAQVQRLFIRHRFQVGFFQVGKLGPKALEAGTEKGAVDVIAVLVRRTVRKHVFAIIITERIEKLQARRVFRQKTVKRQVGQSSGFRIVFQKFQDHL